MTTQFFTRQEVAQRLGICERTLKNRLKNIQYELPTRQLLSRQEVLNICDALQIPIDSNPFRLLPTNTILPQRR